MIASQLLLTDDKEDLALNLNGKKRKLKRDDFNEEMLEAQIPEKAIENLWRRVGKGMSEWSTFIEQSFLDPNRKEDFRDLINGKINRLDIKFEIV